MSKTINEARKDVFLNLGGNPSELSDNSTVSDYIEDLGSAIKAEASSASEALIDDTKKGAKTTYSSNKIESIVPVIDDTTASATKVYSSSKVASLIPEGSTEERGYVFGSSTIGNAKTKLIPMRETIPFYMLMGDNVMLMKTGKKTNDEDYVLEVVDFNNNVSYVFHRQNLRFSPSVWVNVSRTQNATVYKSFEIADTDGDGDMKPITTVTVNDPT